MADREVSFIVDDEYKAWIENHHIPCGQALKVLPYSRPLQVILHRGTGGGGCQTNQITSPM